MLVMAYRHRALSDHSGVLNNIEETMTKYYVIALSRAFLPNETFDAQKGTIVSRHTESFKASEQADKHNAKNGTTSRKPLFGVLSTQLSLAKGEVREDLADQWIKDRYDYDAIYVMKSILDPNWRDGRPVDEETVSVWLTDLSLTVEDLRIRYQDRAQEELDKANSNRISQAERRARVKANTMKLAAERSQFTYTFPAVAGTQAGQVYYVAQVPMKVLVRLFRFDEEDVVPAQLRAQRVMNEARAEKIGQYMVKNPLNYVLPAITASVSAEMAFQAFEVDGAAGSIGLLHIPMEATLLINDGQHRRAGIERAIKELPALANETIAVVLYFDQGLERSQQMFADINARQVKPSSAINALYDRRNPFNKWVLDMIEQLPHISHRVDFENSSVGAKSSKLWSLIAFKKALSLLTGVDEKTIFELDDGQLSSITAFVKQFFATCSELIPDWLQMITGKIVAFDVRENLVIGHAVWLEGLSVFARQAMFADVLVDHGRSGKNVVCPDSAQWDKLDALAKLDTRKVSLMWDRRCVVLGKMQKTADGVNSTASRMMTLANIPLPQHMRELEQRLAA